MTAGRFDPPTRVHRSANGVTVICDPAPGFDTLALSVVAGRGARWEDAPPLGLVASARTHGVQGRRRSRAARQIVEAIEAQGGQLNAATGHERTSFQVRAPGGRPAAGSGDRRRSACQRPTLDADDLDREKRVVAQEIAEAADTPDDQVFELAQSAAFPDQPLGGRSSARPSTIVSRADPASLGGLARTVYAPDRLVISAAGAVDEARTSAAGGAAFRPAAAASAEPAPAAAFVGGAVAERRRLEQAHLVFLLPAPGSLDDDFWALRLFAEMLGGGMSSRLFQEARERLGLAYAIDAYSDTYADVGVLGVYAGCAARDAARLARGDRPADPRPGRPRRTGGTGARQGAAEGRAVHGPRIPGSPGPNRPPATG